MNLYVLLRVFFHSLLVVDNLLALTAASWNIWASKVEGQHRASPGAVLVILGCVAFVVLTVITWAEICVPRTYLSRVRTEVGLVPMLIVFKLITAGVVTSDTINYVCRDPFSCVALVVLSWLTLFSLLVYFLMVLAITLDHAKLDPDIWNASFLEYPWFTRPPPKGTDHPVGRSTITPPMSLRVQPSAVDHRRQESPRMPRSSNGSIPSQQNTPGSNRTFLPRWAKELRPLQRGKELPFPIAASHRRYSDPRRLDAPVPPSMYTEHF